MKTKRFSIWLIMIPICVSFFMPIIAREYILENHYDDTSFLYSIKSQTLTYRISNYVVSLEINGLDIQAQVNITYNVTSGTKYSGFKRFICPELVPFYAIACISQSSIEVHDYNDTKLNCNYKEFQGKNGVYYKEISFSHEGFMGVKTFSLNFLMKNWIIERFGASDIHLFNIGTFSIPVDRAEYILIFPENHVVSSAFSGTDGTEKIEKMGNKYVYTLVQTSSITNDVSIRTYPNITNTPPWLDLYWIFVLLLIFGIIGISIVIGYKIYKYYDNMPEEEKQRRRELKEQRRAQREALGGCAGCGGCGGGCGGCGGGGGGGGGCGGCGG